MNKKLIAILTCVALLTPGFLPIGHQSQQAMAQTTPTESNQPQTVSQDQSAPPRHYYQSSRERRSYQRETRTRHHRITKQEVIFLAAVAGTPMGIGAIAGGAHGLAIGSIVGGWAAFGAHRLWKHIQ
jgi:hypothetical protein